MFQWLCILVQSKNMVFVSFFWKQTVDLKMPTWLDYYATYPEISTHTVTTNLSQTNVIQNWWLYFWRSFSDLAIDHLKELVHDIKFAPNRWFIPDVSYGMHVLCPLYSLKTKSGRVLSKSGNFIKQVIQKVIMFLEFSVNYIIYLNLKFILLKVIMWLNLM